MSDELADQKTGELFHEHGFCCPFWLQHCACPVKDRALLLGCYTVRHQVATGNTSRPASPGATTERAGPPGQMAKQYDRLAVAVFFHAIGKDALTVEFDE